MNAPTEQAIQFPEAQTSPRVFSWSVVERALEGINGSRWVEDFTAFPEMLVGQEQQQVVLEEFMTTAVPGDILLIQGRFGSGKTSLRWAVENRLGITQDQVAEAPANFAMSEIRDNLSLQDFLNTNARSSSPKIAENIRFVVVEEVGRASKEDLSQAIGVLRELLDNGQLPPLIITGEETLDDPRLYAELGTTPEKVKKIVMEPLTPELMQKAVSMRLSHSTRLTTMEEILAKARSVPVKQTMERLAAFEKSAMDEIDVSSLFAPGFLEAMLYPNDYGAVNFRDGKDLLQAIAGSNRRSAVPAVFDQTAYLNFKAQHLKTETTPAQKDCIAWLQNKIREHFDSGEPFRSLSTKDIMKGILGNTYEIDRYNKRVLVRLIDHGLLIPVNTNDFDKTSVTDGGPRYLHGNTRLLPTAVLFLDTAYDPISVTHYNDEGYTVNEATPAIDQAHCLLSSYLRREGPGMNPEDYRKASGRLIVLLTQQSLGSKSDASTGEIEE